MRRTRIDFAPPGWRRTLWCAPPALALAVPGVLALCVATLLMGQRYLERQDALRDLRAALAVRSAPAPKAAPPAPALALSPAQAGAVNAAILQLNLPWRDLAAALGNATPNTIALLALEPDAKRRTLRIGAEARSSEAMLAYITRLQAEAWFSSVVLLRHEVMEQDPNRPLRFQVSVQWDAA